MIALDLLAEIKRRAGDSPRPDSPDHALTTLLALGALEGPEGKAIRSLLRAIVAQSDMPLELNLNALGPLSLAALDRLFEGLVHEGFVLRTVPRTPRN